MERNVKEDKSSWKNMSDSLPTNVTLSNIMQMYFQYQEYGLNSNNQHIISNEKRGELNVRLR